MRRGKGERIGILGGTFNPPHIGHLVLAQDAIECLRLDRIILIPCSHPPHKTCTDLAPARERLAMVRGAVRGCPRVEVSDIEIRRGGLSYAVDTLTELRERFPNATLIFMIGSDSLPDLHLWRRIDELLGLCQFAVFHRPGHAAKETKPESLRLPAARARRILRNVFRVHAVEVSSSEIRDRIALGKSIRFLVHPAVERYIESRHLYRAESRGTPRRRGRRSGRGRN